MLYDVGTGSRIKLVSQLNKKHINKPLLLLSSFPVKREEQTERVVRVFLPVKMFYNFQNRQKDTGTNWGTIVTLGRENNKIKISK